MADALLVVLRKVALSLAEGALEKIGKEVVEAAPLMTDFEHSMKQIEGELSVLQAFINQVNAQRVSDKAFDAWLDQVRDVAHEVEDIIDEYAYLTAQAVDTSSFFKRKFHQFKGIAAWKKFPGQISQVEARIQRLSEMRNRYGFSVSQLDRTNNFQLSNQFCLSDSAYLIDNSEIVGNADEIGKLTQWLLEEKQDRSLIAILGMGGLGKTAIASTVYKNQKIITSFDCHAWVIVSQTYQVEELLREIINQLIIKERASMASGFMTMSRMRLVEVIQSYLRDKKYFVVLDDVWDKDAWLFLNYAFVRNERGSKVLITTRRKDVSSLAADNYVIELKTLKDAESWELFCKKAFHASEDNICPENIRCWATKIVAKCQGLPLAIVTIGSILSYRDLKEHEWAFFFKQLSWQLANNPELSWISSVLKLSLNDLPSYLRSCFLYCSIFPEDYKIRRKLISKLWIAEGLVEERGDGTTMEEVAECYLMELTQRSLLQVTERKACGRARTFLMHDLVREVTSTIAKKEKFSVALAHGGASTSQVAHEARRLCIQRGAQTLNSFSSSRLRSFILFDTEVPCSWIHDTVSCFRLLRVLCLRFVNVEQVPGVITELYNLRYLDMSYTKVKMIPASFGKLVNLQVLDLRDTYVEELPLEITMLTKLRQLQVYALYDILQRSPNSFSATKFFGNICHLKNLQALQVVSANKDLVSQLGNLNLMRSLAIAEVRQSYIAELWNSLTKMPNLKRLIISTCNVNETLDMEMLKPLPNLTTFVLSGKLERGLLPSIFSVKLKQLKLDWSSLKKDPVSSLSHMLNLVDLFLTGGYAGEQLTFRNRWFPNLKCLQLADMEHLNWIEVEDGTMMNLQCLSLAGLRNLKAVPDGIKYIRALHEMFLTDMSNEFIVRLHGSDNHIVQHIPNIKKFESSDSQAGEFHME
jgi:disease resistance protein RPM1